MRWRRGGRIVEFLYDAWAILAHLEDPRFTPYFRSGRGVTTWLHLMEVYYALLRDGASETEADRIVAAFRPSLLEFSFREVQEAMILRLRWRKRGKNLSYADAISYHLARQRDLRFLTGDPAFRGAPGVLFLRFSGR